MQDRTKHKFRTVIPTLLLVWATTFFWLLCPILAVNVMMLAISLVVLLSIIFNRYYQFVVIFLSFQTSYVFYGYMLVNNLPSWLIMLGVLVISFFLLSYVEQKNDTLLQHKALFKVIYSLLILETFLFLGYFLISPINRSLIIALTLYLIVGFNEDVVQKKQIGKMVNYLFIFLVNFVTIILTASWGRF